jgi:hypothetical protein
MAQFVSKMSQALRLFSIHQHRPFLPILCSGERVDIGLPAAVIACTDVAVKLHSDATFGMQRVPSLSKLHSERSCVASKQAVFAVVLFAGVFWLRFQPRDEPIKSVVPGTVEHWKFLSVEEPPLPMDVGE